MSVYTRVGDKGKTHLYQGKTISKSSLRIDVIGSVDELNSIIGLVLAEVRGKQGLRADALKKLEIRNELVRVQNDLFEIGGALANPSSKVQKLSVRVTQFEKIIDKLENDLPPLSNFILPGGGRAGSYLHLARTVSRRAERRIVELNEQDRVQQEIIIYMNRLSDLLFMFARFINYKEKKKEVQWKSR